MKWNPRTAPNFHGIVQTTQEGTTRTFQHYYIKKLRCYGVMYAVGRYTFGREIDYRENFSTLKEAREFASQIDRETLIIEEVRA